MRYFRAFYASEDCVSPDDSLQPVHSEFDDKVFVLPYRRSGYSEERRECFCATLIAKDGAMGESAAQRCLERALRIWGLEDLAQTRIEECTIEGCFLGDVYRYSSCSFDESHIKHQLNLANTYSFSTRPSRGLKERIVSKPLGEEAAMELAADSGYEGSLKAELARIFAPAVQSVPASGGSADAAEGGTIFAPISYIVEGNANSDADEAISILLGAMVAAGRASSSHVFTLDIDNYSRWPMHGEDFRCSAYLNHQLIRAIEGNVLVIRYGALEGTDHYDKDAYALFTRTLDLIEDAQCKTQVFFSVPESKKDMLMRLRRRYNKPIVLISKDRGSEMSRGSFERNLAKMESMAADRGITPDESMGVLLSKRMRANDRAELERVFDEWATYHDARLAFPQYASAIDEAIDLDGAVDEVSAQTRLESLIGLESVKEHIRNIVLRVQMNQQLLERGLPLQPFSMHMAFVGSPGTGKTEVARLYAEILKDHGILSEGRLVTVSGGSGFNVREAFEAAKGSVLFVDEAYGLVGYDGLITELIARMETSRADTVVILAGYQGHMNALFDCNPGFRSRVGFTIKFPDYTSDELQSIFSFMCERRKVVIEEGAREVVRDVVERGGKRADQGNARFIRKLFEDAVGAQQVRLAKRSKEDGEELTVDDLRTLTIADIEQAAGTAHLGDRKNTRSAREELDALIGLSGVKKLVEARMDFAKMQKVKRDAGLKASFIPLHMAFKGNPGTGKTEVARLVGRILREEGVLSVGDVYECGRQDLVSPAVGGSAPMVEALFQKARGSVIFIDEAYSLIDGAKGGPGDEAINALIDQMEKLRDEVVVILAGYTKEIDDLLSLNPGFKSRTKVQLEFPDYSADELVSILHHMAEKQGYALGEGIDEKVHGFIEKGMRDDAFGNARFVRNLLEDAIVAQSVRLSGQMDAEGAEGGHAGQGGAPSVEELSLLLVEDFAWEGQEAASRGIVGFAA